MQRFRTTWRWFLLLTLYSTEAHGWGLYTHVYFAQHLLWAIPLTDPRYYRAARQFPRLVLAGACLPDLALVCAHFGLHRLAESHEWRNPHALLQGAGSDAERAIALGYTSHLWVDVIAHNHFVPAHERMWADIPVATHAAAEWAMDHYVGAQIYTPPAQLLRAHEADLAEYVSRHFGGSARAAQNALRCLTGAEAALRRSGLPWLCLRTAQTLDRGVQRRFNYYLGETAGRLRHINRLLAGETPEWLAEPASPEAARVHVDAVSRLTLRHRIPLPHDFFARAER